MVGSGHSGLPEDVVFEILLKLPVTSICRFKCVCRYWYDVIKRHVFKEQHYALQQNSTLLAVEYSGAANIFSDKFLRTKENLRMSLWGSCITGPCRGLFLLHTVITPGANLGLLNPATSAFRLLPRSPCAVIHYSFEFYAYGLGWDSTRNDYKVVFILFKRQIALVYSLNNDSWRFLDSPLPLELSGRSCLTTYPQHNIYTNGFCYWLPYAKNASLLFCFNMAQENFVTIALPPIVINNRDTIVISTYYDSLAFLAWNEEREVIEVWVLQQEQHYWTKVYNFGQIDPTVCPIGIWNNTYVLLRKCVSRGSKKLLAYDMKNDRYEEKINTHILDPRKVMCFLNYKKSLFLIQGGSKNWTPSVLSSNHIPHFFRHTLY
ncbi:PREDICTED: F-box protein At1g11270-like [Ipomoea nil]|uniref:F-box protein At1g11270-like n=1 Tax=Ipomoea nil TaxID=35883 RepID=UPI000900F6B8|nr:PREDICTED: F-box protein At1g11270-like [Ipomoea nil]